ncbi:MAG: hypothetical protein SXV54_14305 [Chloroflexota bacterium]|nr:hypothetical protein [Chloroflexota bacterium]
MSVETPIVLITPEAQAALEAEVERAGISGGLAGGLLFGYPQDEHHRLVVSSARMRPEVGFGRRDFCLDQSRTSQQLDQARKLAPEAHYCGVWYIHRTPNQELTDEEWVQTQSVLEDPDFRFKDLVCLVLCLYFGELKTYASYFDKYHSARSQFPEPTLLQLTTDSLPTPAQASLAYPSAPQLAPSDWYRSPDAAGRLNLEYERLEHKYHVEAAISSDGQMIFRLMPKSAKGERGKLTFYLACEQGFPRKMPDAFLLAGGKRHPLSSPDLDDWSVERWLVEVADDLVKWLALSLDQYVVAAKDALDRGNYQEAADLLTIVLSMNPRMPRAARLLARAQAPLG